MKLLNAKTSFVPFPPFLDVNENPSDVFDKLTSAGHLYNSLLRHASLNATISISEKMGECCWNDNHINCTGIFKALVDGDIDFSLYAQVHENYDDRNLITHLFISPQVTSQEDPVFVSTAEVPDSISDVSQFAILAQIPLLIVLLNFLTLILVILVINFQLKPRDKRIDIIDAIVLHTLHWSRDFKSNARRIIFLFILVYCFVSHYFYSALVSSDLIVNVPAKYLESINDIVDSNRTPGIFEGLALKNNFLHSNDPKKLLLLDRAEKRNTLYSLLDPTSLLVFAKRISENRHVGLFDSLALALNVKALVCVHLIQTDRTDRVVSLPKLKVTPMGSVAHSGYMYSRGIDEAVRQRIEKAIFWLAESGQYEKLKYDQVPQFENTAGVTKEKLVYCLSHLDKKKQHDQKEIFLHFIIMWFFLKAWALGILIACVCFAIEHIWRVTRKNKAKTRLWKG
jgi:predicted outer membrane lipoprotein